MATEPFDLPPASGAVIIAEEAPSHLEAPRGSVIAQVVSYRRDPLMRGSTKWSRSLFGCAENKEICCEELCCPYCHLGFMYEYVETGGRQMNPMACCGALCADVYFLACGVARCALIGGIRLRLLKRYDIEETSTRTCCVSCCCSCCAMCQMHSEMHRRWDTPGGFLVNSAPQLNAPMGLPHGDEPASPARVITATNAAEFSSRHAGRTVVVQPTLSRYGYSEDNHTGYPVPPRTLSEATKRQETDAAHG
jgi:Cys-rich protein (TIGR01571 family)